MWRLREEKFLKISCVACAPTAEVATPRETRPGTRPWQRFKSPKPDTSRLTHSQSVSEPQTSQDNPSHNSQADTSGHMTQYILGQHARLVCTPRAVTTAWRRDGATAKRRRRHKHRSSPQTPNSINGLPSRRIRENDMIVGPQGGLCDGMIMAALRKRRFSNCQSILLQLLRFKSPEYIITCSILPENAYLWKTQYIWCKYIYYRGRPWRTFPKIRNLCRIQVVRRPMDFGLNCFWNLRYHCFEIHVMRLSSHLRHLRFNWFDFRLKWFDC